MKTLSIPSLVSRDALNDSINALDKDKTGKIDLNLFRQVLTSIGEPMDDISTSELFRYFGVNDDDTTIDAQKLYDLLSTISDGLQYRLETFCSVVLFKRMIPFSSLKLYAQKTINNMISNLLHEYPTKIIEYC